MRSDVLAALSGVFPSRIPTKETLNHPGLVRRVCVQVWGPLDGLTRARFGLDPVSRLRLHRRQWPVEPALLKDQC